MMTGDKIYPKNCIEGMPKPWKCLLYIVDKWFMSKEAHRELFEDHDIDLMARSKSTGRFVKTPLLYDEHFNIKKAKGSCHNV